MKLKSVKEILLLIIVELITLIRCYTYRNYFFDDVLIYSRYFRNFKEGYGLVYNKDEIFNGLTSPLFAYINILFNILFNVENQILLNNIIGTFFFVITILVMYLVLKKKKYNFNVIAVVLILYALSNIYLFIGMETGLYIFLIFLIYYFYHEKKYFLYFTFSSLLILTRSEGIFFIIATVFLFFIQKRKIERKFFLYITFATLLLLIHFSFNYFYYGNILPDSSKAKIYQGQSHLWGNQKDFIKNGFQFLTYDYSTRNKFKYLYYFIIIFIPTIIIFKKKNSFDLYLIFSNVLLLIFYLYNNVPMYHWYLSPLIFTKIYFIVVGINILLTKILSKKLIHSSFLIGVLTFLFSFSLNYNKDLKNTEYDGNKLNPGYVKVADWIKYNTDKNASIGMSEIGIIGYYSDRKIIDMCGLVSKENAYFLSKRDINSFITVHHPDYIFVHDPLWSFIEPNLSLSKDYILDKNFNIKGYKMYKKKYILNKKK